MGDSVKILRHDLKTGVWVEQPDFLSSVTLTKMVESPLVPQFYSQSNQIAALANAIPVFTQCMSVIHQG